MCLAQGHNKVPPVRLKPATLRSLVKHSTTEPLRFQSGHSPCSVLFCYSLQNSFHDIKGHNTMPIMCLEPGTSRAHVNMFTALFHVADIYKYLLPLK